MGFRVSKGTHELGYTTSSLESRHCIGAPLLLYNHLGRPYMNYSLNS